MAVALKDHLASIRLSYLCHRMPGLRWLGRSILPQVYFRWIKLLARIAYYAYPGDRRRLRHMRKATGTICSAAQLRSLGIKNIAYRQWMKVLTHGWPSWAENCQEWVVLRGEEHLTKALDQGDGAVLLSGHSYGFSSMVCPVLSQMGFRLFRMGRGAYGDPAKRWGREWVYEHWDYDAYGQDFWQSLRALNKMRHAIEKNGAVHLLVRGFPQGDPRLEIDFYYKRFFLDPFTFRIIETLRAPVLPCFPLCDDSGRLVITLYPPLAPSTDEVMPVFGPLYSKHLKERPEFAVFWRKLAQQKEGW